ncbi:histidinol-phosphate aminotransferase [Sorangium cellulosum]|uniref:Histidinol-phosphate aminotransferase n=1 Tax=Sorangium cellulosum TaxID=56 RepID=A0A150TV63_SORCE|nr:histidinol-phosphate aminotransferase [Sorangium cellulosum]
MSALVLPTVEMLAPYEAGKPIEELARELGVTDAVKLASNENPLGPSPRAVEAARRELATMNFYPDASAYRLRERLAAVHGVAMEEIVQGNGSNELLDLMVHTFATPGSHIVFGDPAFVVYKLAALAYGVPFTAVPLRDLRHDLEAMAAAVTPKTRLLFVANPNNPTGTHVGRGAVERLLKEVPPEVVIVMDEAYIEYTDAPDFPDSMRLRHLRERLLVVRTFSKIYGLAGLRVGYAVGPAKLIDYMNRTRAPFNVGAIAQAAAIAALDDAEHVEKSRALNLRERDRLTHELTRLGLSVAPSQANFVLVDVRRPARPVYDALLRKGVIVRPFGNLPTSLRVTIGTERENQRFLDSLADALK